MPEEGENSIIDIYYLNKGPVDAGEGKTVLLIYYILKEGTGGSQRREKMVKTQSTNVIVKCVYFNCVK